MKFLIYVLIASVLSACGVDTFALSALLPPEIWNAINVWLKGVKP
jgi:hypothetical protein